MSAASDTDEPKALISESLDTRFRLPARLPEFALCEVFNVETWVVRCKVSTRVNKRSWFTAGEVIVHHNPLPRSRVGRIAWSWFRHPVKSREFPAKHERLVTPDELLRFGF
jgi:hypothetical protein